MRRELNNLNADLVQDHRYDDYVCRVSRRTKATSAVEPSLSNFQDLERRTPVILTTSQLLTTGVDAPTVQNVVLVRTINSMTEFKQIIGRGTRVRDDYGKLFFSILDYTGSATRLFADPDFDGDPVTIETVEIDGSAVIDGRRSPGRGLKSPRATRPTANRPVMTPEAGRTAAGRADRRVGAGSSTSMAVRSRSRPAISSEARS